MHVALTYPWCWPEVQRGGERLFADLGTYLASAGHRVTTISTRGSVPATPIDGARDVRVRGWALAPEHRFGLDRPVTFQASARRALRQVEPDVVAAMHHLDGVAARTARGAPYVLHVQGMPRRSALRGRVAHRLLLPVSLGGATAIISVSRAASAALQREFGVASRPVHNGVDTSAFRSVGTSRADEPTVLFPGDPDDPRKRLDLLVDALQDGRVDGVPIRLVVAARPSASTRQRLTHRLGDRVSFLEVSAPSAMPEAYASSWVTCLPARHEAFGLVFVEAMATGRPAVGADDGGVPEVVTEKRWLAAPDDPAALAAALGRAFEDAGDEGTVAHCRDLAARFDWSVRGPEFEAVYADGAERS